MKKRILVFIFLFCTTILVAQTGSIDSLNVVLKNAKNDIEKTEVFNAIANEYKTSDPKLMQDFATKALQLSQKIEYKIEEGFANLNMGNVNIISGNYSEALKYFATAQNIFENEKESNPDKILKIKKGLAKAYGSIGIVFSEQSNYSKALQFHFKAIKIYEAINDQKKCAQVYNNIGVEYKSLGSDFKALDYFLKAEKIQEKLKDTNIGITLTNIANCYLKQKNNDKALDYYNQAKINFDKNPDARALGEWYNNMGLFYQANKNTTKAIENWNLAIQTSKIIDDKFGLANTHIYLSELYLAQNNLPLAIENTSKAANLAKETGSLEQTVFAEKLFSSIYKLQNNTALALQHYELYSQAKDSMTSEENIRKGVEAAMTFEFDKRENALQKKNLLLQEQSKQNKLQLLFAGLFALMLAGIGFLIYNRMQLKKTLTLQKELAEYEQKALHLQMNPHFVFNCLGSISSFIVQNGAHSAVRYLSKFSKLMRLTLEYSKQSLIPIDKEILSLQNYLELEQLRFNQKFDFTITKDEAIEDGLALPPLLLQPFVENAIIHGIIPSKEQGTIGVDFKLDAQHLICTITDNGIGFEKSKAIKQDTVVVHKSMALDITKKRLEMIATSTSKKAKITIEELHPENHDRKGTKVTLYLPVQFSPPNPTNGSAINEQKN